MWGQPGKIKVTGFLSRGRPGDFADAIALAQATGTPADTAPGAQPLSTRARHQRQPGAANHRDDRRLRARRLGRRHVEPWDFTDIDRTVSGGVSINGKQWGRPDDTIGIAGIVNGIAGVHRAYFNAGGNGHPDRRRATAESRTRADRRGLLQLRDDRSTRVSVDYQFIVNPGYNADRGPVNVFAGRVHTHSDIAILLRTFPT